MGLGRRRWIMQSILKWLCGTTEEGQQLIRRSMLSQPDARTEALPNTWQVIWWFDAYLKRQNGRESRCQLPWNLNALSCSPWHTNWFVAQLHPQFFFSSFFLSFYLFIYLFNKIPSWYDVVIKTIFFTKIY